MLNISKKHHNLITPELQTVSGGGGGGGKQSHFHSKPSLCSSMGNYQQADST